MVGRLLDLTARALGLQLGFVAGRIFVSRLSLPFNSSLLLYNPSSVRRDCELQHPH